MGPFGAIRWRKKEPVSRPSERRAEKKYTIVYKRGGHAPCSCDVTLKKDDGNVGVDNCSALGGGMIKADDNYAKEHTLN